MIALCVSIWETGEPGPQSFVSSMDHPSIRLRWIVTAPALVLPLVASFFYFVFFPGTAFGNGCYVAIKLFLLTWPLIAGLAILREKPGAGWGTKRRRRGVIEGGIFGIATSLLLFGLLQLPFFAALLQEQRPVIEAKVEGLGVAEHFLLFAVFLSVAHAWLEEFYWRWFVYGQLRRLVSQPLAHGLAAAGFASHHIVILSQFFPLPWGAAFGVCVGLGGLAWSLLLERHRSLTAPWFSHMIIDFAAMAVAWWILNSG